jgi:leucyl aminopeptidase
MNDAAQAQSRLCDRLQHAAHRCGIGNVDGDRVRAEAAGNGMARQLAALPPNELTPGAYRERVARLAVDRGLSYEFHDITALKRRGAGAFLAVVQGSTVKDAGIVHLGYRPPVLKVSFFLIRYVTFK